MKAIKILISLLVLGLIEYGLLHLPYNDLIFFISTILIFWEILYIEYVLQEPRFKKRFIW